MTLDLHAASTAFAQEIEDLLEGVLPHGSKDQPDQSRIRVLQQAARYVIRTGTGEKAGGMSLYSEGKHVGDLHVSYHCARDQANDYLAVRKSMFQVTSPQEGTPLLRLDFNQAANAVPAAHWNVHGERGATSVMLAWCNAKHSGLLSQVHLPVGGIRGRPCLEDFIDMLITEFGIDSHRGWASLIKAGREKWRTLQTKSCVRDSPEAAASVLRRLGYDVTAPVGGLPTSNSDMLRCR
jgi:hypothetical protein